MARCKPSNRKFSWLSGIISKNCVGCCCDALLLWQSSPSLPFSSRTRCSLSSLLPKVLISFQPSLGNPQRFSSSTQNWRVSLLSTWWPVCMWVSSWQPPTSSTNCIVSSPLAYTKMSGAIPRRSSLLPMWCSCWDCSSATSSFSPSPSVF